MESLIFLPKPCAILAQEHKEPSRAGLSVLCSCSEDMGMTSSGPVYYSGEQELANLGGETWALWAD